MRDRPRAAPARSAASIDDPLPAQVASASKESSSSSRSITVCSRRAPMFSVRSFTSAAMRAISSIAVVAELHVDPLGGEQRRVLPDERVPRLLQDADEVGAR